MDHMRPTSCCWVGAGAKDGRVAAKCGLREKRERRVAGTYLALAEELDLLERLKRGSRALQGGRGRTRTRRLSGWVAHR